VIKTDNFTAICESTVREIDISQTHVPPRPATRTVILFYSAKVVEYVILLVYSGHAVT
jgi:hypothetical protein